MIIQQITLKPFAGIANKTLQLQSGLNVILGPNEAGKSTFFRAVQCALFLPVKARKNSREWIEAQRIIPVDGDTATVELRFTLRDKPYVLEKSWGAFQETKLEIPGGTVLRDPDSIDTTLGHVLPAPEATCRSVLMAHQGGLPETLRHIESDGTTAGSLGDMLRSAVRETDGISVEAFKEKLDAEYKRYFSRWDRLHECPENNRGINKPYVKDVGEVLGAYYTMERTKAALEQVRKYEEERDRLVTGIAHVRAAMDEHERFLEKNRPVLESARERRTLEAEREAQKAGLTTMQADNERWPVAEMESARIRGQLPELEDKLERLIGEQETAEHSATTASLREQLSKATAVKESLKKAETVLRDAPCVTGDQIESIRSLGERVSRLEASMKAGKLTLAFTPRRSCPVRVRRDLAEAQDSTIAAEEESTIQAGRRITLETEDWSLIVTSGDPADVEELQAELERARGELTSLLTTCKVGSYEEARDKAAAYATAHQEVASQQKTLALILGDTDYTKLMERVEALGPRSETRPLSEIVQERTEAVHAHKEAMRRERELIAEIESLQETYTDKMSLLLKVAETATREKSLRESIDSLAPLPPDCTDPSAFLEKFSAMENEFRSLQQRHTELSLKRAGLEGSEPEESSEDLETALVEANERLRNIRRKAEAVARIAEVSDRILSESDTDTFAQLERELVQTTTAMTRGKYEEITMNDAFLQGVVRPDGAAVEYDLLSGGTKDAIALALRLTIASYFLRSSGGFLFLDDPLVDMDPDRQAAAAKLLASFASKKQLIIFTCHPSHARLFGDGENLIVFRGPNA